MLREECREEKECAHYKAALEKCARRVERHPERGEECSDELIDFMHCTEHCVSHPISLSARTIIILSLLYSLTSESCITVLLILFEVVY